MKILKNAVYLLFLFTIVSCEPEEINTKSETPKVQTELAEEKADTGGDQATPPTGKKD